MAFLTNEEQKPMTHRELVKKAAGWLKNERCGVVIAELVTYAGEIPDALGFHNGHSVLIECKTSRADFLADREKLFRQIPEKGMGDHRYFMAPKGVLTVEDLPPGWPDRGCPLCLGKVFLPSPQEV